MKNKTIVLAIVGIALLSIGSLNILGYINLTVVDTTPPEIIYTFPQANALYRMTETDEYVAYVQDPETEVTSASYSDDKAGTLMLQVTPYTLIKHPFILIVSGVEFKYPDVNFDGFVNQVDVDLIGNAYGTHVGDPDYNIQYDLNKDGKVSYHETFIVSQYYGTTTFKASGVTTYTPGNVTFAFSALNKQNMPTSFSGTFTVEDYTLLKGKWRINGMTVNSTTIMEVEDRLISVSFIKDETETTPDAEITVKATVKDAVYFLVNTASGTWQKDITLYETKNPIILDAYSTLAKNKIVTTVTLPKQKYSIIGIGLILAGVICLVAGIMVEKREPERKFQY